ncbi:restriction endonuclease subunit S [Serratia marcescens]|nr:restriction endonuclease subunit S [Serratia marcescens]
MSIIDKLLEGVEVEWKTLGETGELVRGNGLQKKDFTESGVPAIHYGQIYTYYGLSTIKTKSFVSPELATKLRKVNKGDVVITNTSENLEDVGKALVYLGEKQAVTGGHATIFKPNEIILGKYFAYFTQTAKFANEKRKYAKGAKVIDVSATDMAKIKIPIPCPESPKKSLEIQGGIVRILDTFSSLTAELKAELKARKKQYNYYRDQLLSFEKSEVEWKTLGELCSISVGQALVSNEAGEYPFVNAGTTPSGYFSSYNTEPDMITTPSRGQGGIGYVGYQTTHFWCGPLCYRIRSTSEILSTRYLYYVMANSMKDIIGLANMTGVPALNKKDLVSFPVPIPPPAKQARIVAILDKFDALTNSISEGLPREIALRQKQYEYYRDLLLSFPRSEEVVA